MTTTLFCESCGRPSFMSHRRFCKANRAASAQKAAATRARNDAETSLAANPFEVGDILNSSWGYDQTNVEFYQVIATTRATVTLREIVKFANQQPVYMTATVWPCKDQFKGPELRRRVNRYGRVKLEKWGIWLNKWNGAGQHTSSYA